MNEKKRKRSLLAFLGIFDLLAIGSIVAFVLYVFPEMDWMAARSHYAAFAFILAMVGIVSLFAMFHVQALYPTLDAHVENGKQILDDTPKNRKFAKIMNTLKWVGVGGLMLALALFVITQVAFGVN